MPPPELYDEQRVLLLLAQGSEYAFTQLFDHYRGNLYTTAVRFLKSPVLAEETVQDVFLKVWLKRSTMHEVKNLEGFLFLMTRNFIFDRMKKIALDHRVQKEALNNPSTVNDTDHLVQDNLYQEILQKAIAELSPQQKEVYRLSRVEGLSRDEIAEKMNISPLTVKTHIKNALDTIRKYLKQYPDLSFLLVLFSSGQ